VFEDRNGNSTRDPGERGLARVTVSNQASVVASGPDGEYALDGGEGFGVVFVGVPSGYRAPRAWRAVPPPAAAAERLDFPLVPAPAPEEFTFLHASDPHVSPESIERLRRVRAIAEERRPAFVVITGDLVKDALRVGEAEARGYFELYRDAIANFPVPVWSALGNHDIFGIERHRSGVAADHPLYGKRMFRSYLGPSYYSFNHGRLHFVALDTVDVADLWYHGRVDAGQLAWLERDLAALPDGASVVTFNHIPLLSAFLALSGYEEGEGAVHTLIEVDGRRQFRHVVSNTAEVLARFGRVRLPLALGGHIHARESVRFETRGAVTRFHQSASIVPAQGYTPPMVAGVTLYRVRGDEVDDGEFIALDPRE
jgi:hypothetical protein